jgi:hypothetical protein
MKFRLLAPKDVFVKKLKISDSIQDKKHITLNFREVDIPKVAGEFQTLGRALYREWPYILKCVKALSAAYQKSSWQEVLKDGALDILKDVKEYEKLINPNIYYAYMPFHEFYKYACKPAVSRKFTIPTTEKFRLYVSNAVECGYMPDLVHLFEIPYHGTNSEYFKLQIHLFEFLNTLALKKISFEVSHYFNKEVVARKI